MPEYIIIRCFKCETFQVQQKKKANKWKCSLCGEQQSLKKIFGIANQAKDLRPVVQEYNMKRGEMDIQESYEAVQTAIQASSAPKPAQKEFPEESEPRKSEWDLFHDDNKDETEDVADDPDDDGFLGGADAAWRQFQSRRGGRGALRGSGRGNSNTSRPIHKSDDAPVRAAFPKRKRETDSESYSLNPIANSRQQTSVGPSRPSPAPWANRNPAPIAVRTQHVVPAVPLRPNQAIDAPNTLEEDEDPEIAFLLTSRQKQMKSAEPALPSHGANSSGAVSSISSQNPNQGSSHPKKPASSSSSLWGDFDDGDADSASDSDDGFLRSAPDDGPIFFR